jgi:hypothetical protein
MKRASRPIHIAADYERYLWKAGETFKTDIYLLNDTQDPVKGLTFTAKLISCEGKILVEKSGLAETNANSSAKISTLEFNILESFKSKTFFVSVELKSESGGKISDAMYTIAVSAADNLESYNNIFSELNKIPKLTLKVEPVSYTISKENSGAGNVLLLLSNQTEAPAFFILTRLLEESDNLRTIYNDNYISLLPGETKTISVNVESKGLKTLPKKIHFEISGLNCLTEKIEAEFSR